MNATAEGFLALRRRQQGPRKAPRKALRLRARRQVRRASRRALASQAARASPNHIIRIAVIAASRKVEVLNHKLVPCIAFLPKMLINRVAERVLVMSASAHL